MESTMRSQSRVSQAKDRVPVDRTGRRRVEHRFPSMPFAPGNPLRAPANFANSSAHGPHPGPCGRRCRDRYSVHQYRSCRQHGAWQADVRDRRHLQRLLGGQPLPAGTCLVPQKKQYYPGCLHDESTTDGPCATSLARRWQANKSCHASSTRPSFSRSMARAARARTCLPVGNDRRSIRAIAISRDLPATSGSNRRGRLDASITGTAASHWRPARRQLRSLLLRPRPLCRLVSCVTNASSIDLPAFCQEAFWRR